MVGISDSEKNFEHMYDRLHTIPTCDGRTDILPRHSPRYAYASRRAVKMNRSILLANSNTIIEFDLPERSAPQSLL